MISRRNFITRTAMASSAVFLVPAWLRAQDKQTEIGLQLYTVRDEMDRDLSGTLKRIASIGYTALETAGYAQGLFYGVKPADFKRMVEDLGMRTVSSHASFDDREMTRLIDAHEELGIEYVVIPSLPGEQRESADDYKRAAEKLNENGILTRMAGIRLGYHNHDFEFATFGRHRAYDILLKETDPGLVCFEADIYWMIKAGVDPLHYFSQYPGRFELWHVKDMDDTPERGFTEVGQGTIPYHSLFDIADDIGLKHFFVEQDQCNKPPLESIEMSYDYIKMHLWP